MTASVPTTVSPWRDSPRRYGRISRWLHWGMAALLAWQFAGVLAKELLGRTSLPAALIGPTHPHIGLLLLVLVVLRALWGLSQLGRRPSDPGWAGRAAHAGHAVLYLLMVAVPLLATLRLLGGTRPFAWFGLVTLNDGRGSRVDWMVELASPWHGLLGWLLLALVAGHVLMVLVDRVLLADGVAARMIGRVRD